MASCSAPDESSSDANAAPVTTSQRRLVRVETHVIQPSDFTDVIELTGSVEANNDATISAQTGGTVKFLLPLGSTARAGTVIARIDAGLTDAAVEQAEAQVASATAQHNLARDTFERQEPLFRDSVISALEFEGVRTQFIEAEAQLKRTQGLLRQTREQAAYARITAPFTGRVEQHFVEVGEQAGPGSPIIRIVNTSTVKITTGVPERYAGDIREGSSVLVRFKSYDMDDQSGTVAFAGSVIDRSSRTFPIEIQLTNRDGNLKPEMIGKVLLTRDRLADVIVVPLNSIIRDENGTNVFVAMARDGDKIAERRPVTVGSTYSGRAVILNGLEDGDELIVAGQNQLTPGDRLDVTSVSTTADAVPIAETATTQDS